MPPLAKRPPPFINRNTIPKKRPRGNHRLEDFFGRPAPIITTSASEESINLGGSSNNVVEIDSDVESLEERSVVHTEPAVEMNETISLDSDNKFVEEPAERAPTNKISCVDSNNEFFEEPAERASTNKIKKGLGLFLNHVIIPDSCEEEELDDSPADRVTRNVETTFQSSTIGKSTELVHESVKGKEVLRSGKGGLSASNSHGSPWEIHGSENMPEPLRKMISEYWKNVDQGFSSGKSIDFRESTVADPRKLVFKELDEIPRPKFSSNDDTDEAREQRFAWRIKCLVHVLVMFIGHPQTTRMLPEEKSLFMQSDRSKLEAEFIGFYNKPARILYGGIKMPTYEDVKAALPVSR
ncbi:uncharacterized protein DSM5745_07065 [Aspergillus mulundensis]|uniref:Uncharacterized protein n=1 Tax=Aspergillus mulundensis TaxID=1810919 RepID=A0A3D8RK35_9EURO|nr:hypothetical protein DSM5745_07065 [Aspergillus mulundensis]RDW74403.1 hypothetical protein DSM5745_07065 [Aspergillus mulundensis]